MGNSEFKENLIQSAGLPFDPPVIRRLRKSVQPFVLKNVLFAAIISRRFSIYFSWVFIKLGTHPDTITLWMILTGLLAGGVFFAGHPLLAILVCNLWFILDCSDGEVARFRNRLNPLGGTIDLLAHLINHPLIIGGIAFFYRDQFHGISLVAGFVLLTCDLLMRLLQFLPDAPPQSESEAKAKHEYHMPASMTFQAKDFWIRVIIEFPNYLLFATFTTFTDLWLGRNDTFWLFIAYATLNGLLVAVVLTKKVARIFWKT